jgi:HPt (histidine-containing phosphotransfer) domain-containing protein
VQPKAIVSTRADDPDLDERIDRFVVELAERVDAFQDAEAARDPRALGALAAALAADASALGYPLLVAAAERIAQACGEGVPELLRKGVEDLTELSQRVRRGHRSSAV